jgi:hypothetical protein
VSDTTTSSGDITVADQAEQRDHVIELLAHGSACVSRAAAKGV